MITRIDCKKCGKSQKADYLGKVRRTIKTITKSKEKGKPDLIEHETKNVHLHKCLTCKNKIQTPVEDGLHNA